MPLQLTLSLEGPEAIALALQRRLTFSLGAPCGLGASRSLGSFRSGALAFEFAEAGEFRSDTALALELGLASGLSFLLAPRALDRLVVELLIEAR